METSAIQADVLGPPQCNRLLTVFCKVWLRLLGWEVEASLPYISKFMVIFAPHTSNWDGFLIVPAAFSLRLKPNVLGKKELFTWPIGPVMRWLGGIPVDRNASKDLVSQIVEEIKERERVVIAIAPEGTRSLTKYWKSGFYHIANQAQLPLCFAYLDFERKLAVFDKGIVVSGDIDKDMALIRQFFGKIKAKYPEKAGKIEFKPQV